jgi:hypothetical protein
MFERGRRQPWASIASDIGQHPHDELPEGHGGEYATSRTELTRQHCPSLLFRQLRSSVAEDELQDGLRIRGLYEIEVQPGKQLTLVSYWRITSVDTKKTGPIAETLPPGA